MIEHLFADIDLNALSEAEKAGALLYLDLAGRYTPGEWENPLYKDALQTAVGHVRVFGNNPHKAAETYLQARESWDNAYKEYAETAMMELPAEDAMVWWEENPDEIYPPFHQIGEEAGRAADKVFEAMFLNPIYEYLDKKNGLAG